MYHDLIHWLAIDDRKETGHLREAGVGIQQAGSAIGQIDLCRRGRTGKRAAGLGARERHVDRPFRQDLHDKGGADRHVGGRQGH